MQRLITLALVAFALVWGLVASWMGRFEWTGGGALIVVGGYLAFMAFEFGVMACVHGSDPTPRANLRQIIRAWFGEVTTSPRVFCWDQPFRSRHVPDHLPTVSGRRGVLLVHGFVCNRGFWNGWMPRLKQLGVPFMAVDLEPVFDPIDAHAHAIEQAVLRLHAATGLAPVIVAHSMGGLAVRAWLAGTALQRVHRVITIGSPHHGTWAARFGLQPAARDMRMGSRFIRSLEARETADMQARFTCFYSHCDNIVFPAATACLDRADNRHLTAVAHVHLVERAEVWAETLRWCNDA